MVDFLLIVVNDDGFAAVTFSAIAAVRDYRSMLLIAKVLVQFPLNRLFDQALFQPVKQASLVKEGLWSTAFPNELLDQLDPDVRNFLFLTGRSLAPFCRTGNYDRLHTLSYRFSQNHAYALYSAYQARLAK